MSRFNHQQSHASLLSDVSRGSVPFTRSGLDAIVVPAARASLPQHLITLAAALSVPLVVLCSHQAQIEGVAKRVRNTFGARGLIIDVPAGYPQSWQPLTSASAFQTVSAGRSSDLSVKRNIGLRLARMRGWKKILFVDDDIFQLKAQQLDRLAAQLDRHPVAAMASREFPDNSVVCHARRLAKFRQDVFVSGAVLGVNTQHSEMSFFPDVYNEDWFFFSRHAAERSLPKVGEVRQQEYQPFADPWRARREEFGDLLAEGMYTLFESQHGLNFKDQLRAAASSRFWQQVKEGREFVIQETTDRLTSLQNKGRTVDTWRIAEALESLAAAGDQLQRISPDVCVEFIASWREDESRWKSALAADGTSLTERDALDRLELTNWISCGYGRRDGYGIDTALRRNRTSVRPEESVSC
ncbi:hypothetical protein GCM10009554_35870 [Kribbella koreensis]|uniref:Glycosyl transferase family 2 n=1 Tax=Kribbella koreensis TaxID=57909 RepID=A0ABN1QJG3_9ACTN